MSMRRGKIMMLSTLRMMSRLRRRGPNEEKNKEELAGKDQEKKALILMPHLWEDTTNMAPLKGPYVRFGSCLMLSSFHRNTKWISSHSKAPFVMSAMN
jgi:hypothetical protein